MQYYLISPRQTRKQHIFELWMNMGKVHNTYADEKIFDLKEIHHIDVRKVCTSSNSQINEMLLPFRKILLDLISLNEGIKKLSDEEFFAKWSSIKNELETALERV